MIAPILGLFALLGVASGGQEFFKKKRRERSLGLFDESLQNLGPQLSGSQAQALSGIARAGGVDEGLDMLSTIMQLNSTQRQFTANQAYRTDDLEIRRQSHVMRQAEHQAALAQIRLGTPENILKSKGMTIVQDEQGRNRISFTVGSTEANKQLATLRSTTAGLKVTNDLLESLATNGAVTDISDPESTRQQIGYQRMMAFLRIELGTGTPQAAELELFAKTFPDPQSLWNALVRGDQAAIAGVQSIRQLTTLRAADAARDARFTDFDPQDKQASALELQRSLSFVPVQPGARAPPGVTSTIGLPQPGQTGIGLQIQQAGALIDMLGATGDPAATATAAQRLQRLQEQGEISGRAPVPGGQFLEGPVQAVQSFIQGLF